MSPSEPRALRRALVPWLAGIALLAAPWGPSAWAADKPALKMEPVAPTPVAADLDAGKKLYTRWCAQCHGDEGKGDGPAADFVYPRPRDFTLAIYKVRRTPSGALPTDHDLFNIISEGLPGTSMPAWKRFISEAERWQLVHYVKTFDSLGLFKEEAPKKQIAVEAAPQQTPELVARGRQLYQDKKCGQCHGPLGRGDGPSAAGQKDEWGQPIRPVNFTKSWRFRGGDRVEDIYRTFTTGFNGTPMPSFVDAIPAAEDRWALATYVKSLARAQRTGEVLRAAFVPGAIAEDAWSDQWERAPFTDFPLAGQIIREPRWFRPAHDVITARALYNEREIALLLEWDDGTHDKGEGGKPPDQVALQWPATAAEGSEKPYFLHGDARLGVELWRWNPAQGFTRSLAKGAGRETPLPAGDVKASGAYRDGQYRVILRRPLAAEGAAAPIAPGQFVPLAFQLWDGDNGEKGLAMSMSTWYHVLAQPPTPISAYAWPATVVLAVLALEAALLRRRRRALKTRP
jgi:DMSO reductase family type II enzyme heme b subunit